MDSLVDYLLRKRREEAGWLGVLAAVLVWFFGVIGVIIVNLLADMYATKYFIEHPDSNLIYFGFLLALSVPLGLMTYFYAKKRYTKEYLPWKKTLNELRKTITESRTERTSRTSVTETTLRLMDQINAWIPDLMKHKGEEALTYGIVAFLLTAFISANSTLGMPMALLIGVIVWLYFRYEKRKETAHQIQMLRTWRKKFEEGKDYFLKGIDEGRA